jgi:hypothetical protein
MRIFKKRTFKKRTYYFSEGKGINNEDSFLLMGDGVIIKYYPKKDYSKEEFEKLAKELVDELK